jgi:hypothetical protein
MRSRLFVAHQNMLDFTLLVECIIDVQHGTARVAKNEFDTLFVQRAHKYIRACQFHRSLLLIQLRHFPAV